MLRMLLWKDWRLMRPLLLAAAALFVTPGVIVSIMLILAVEKRPSMISEWAELVGGCLVFGLMVSVLATPMHGANLLAKERRERTAEFVATLPVGRAHIVLSKAIVAILVALAPLVATLALGLALTGVVALLPQTPADHVIMGEMHEFVGFVAVLVGSACLSFGVAWLLSSIVRSETLAAGVSLLLTLATATLIGLVESSAYGAQLSMVFAGAGMAIAGITAFAGGTAIALNRRSP